MYLEIVVSTFLILLGAAAVLVSIWWHSRTESYALGWAAMLVLSSVGWLILSHPVPADWGLSAALGQAVAADIAFLAGMIGLVSGTARYFGTGPVPRAPYMASAACLIVAWGALLAGQAVTREVAAALSSLVLLAATIAIMARGPRRNLGETTMMLSLVFIVVTNVIYTLILLASLPRDIYTLDFVGFRFLSAAMPLGAVAFALSGLVATTLRQLDRLRDNAAALESAVREARLANRAKSEFLGTVSHEIRTPVNALLGGVDILAATPLDARQAQCVAMMGTAGRSLLSLLDDLLDVTRMESGRLKLEEVDFDLHRRVRDVVELMTPRAAEKGLSLSLDIAADVPRHVRADPSRLRQILLNLLGNAVKFTGRGGIEMRVERAVPTAAAEEGRVEVVFAVADTGIGIPADKLACIFEPFTQADGSISRRFGGAGLGLSICRTLAAMMGGGISVESRPSEGSTFRLRLPLAPGRPTYDDGDAPSPLPVWNRPLTLLLVEDESINRIVAVRLLERHGFRVVEASGGRETLDTLARMPVDAILMDLGMPDMDGFEVTARIRAMDGPAARTPIVALTASVLPETIERCVNAGMQSFVAKPIRIPALLRALAEAVPADGTAWPDAAAGATRLHVLRAELGDDMLDAVLDRARHVVSRGRAAILAAADSGDLAVVADEAHRLVSALTAIGMDGPAAPLRQLERTLRRGDDPGPLLPSAVSALSDALALLAPEPQGVGV